MLSNVNQVHALGLTQRERIPLRGRIENGLSALDSFFEDFEGCSIPLYHRGELRRSTDVLVDFVAKLREYIDDKYRRITRQLFGQKVELVLSFFLLYRNVMDNLGKPTRTISTTKSKCRDSLTSAQWRQSAFR